MLQDLPLIIDS